MSHFNRLDMAGTDITPTLQCQLGVNVLPSAISPREVLAESKGLGKHGLLQMKAFFFFFWVPDRAASSYLLIAEPGRLPFMP